MWRMTLVLLSPPEALHSSSSAPSSTLMLLCPPSHTLTTQERPHPLSSLLSRSPLSSLSLSSLC